MGEYTIEFTLSDGYLYGPNEVNFSMTLIMDIPERPFHVYTPKNEGPYFVEDLTLDEVTFDVG